MAFIFRGLLGKPDADASDKSGSSAVEKLLHRVESVTLLADRREGLRALKAIAKDHRLDIAAHGMDVLLTILEQDRADLELVSITLEILCLVMADSEEFDKENGSVKRELQTKLGAQFTEIFLKKGENLALLLDFSKEFQFQVRWPAVRLLCIMANSSPKAMQDALLRVAGGITSLMDLLTDNREIIRNDGLLLLIFVIRNNPSLQKIVAFSKAFDTLLDIVRDEGGSEGGVVVEDCLLLISNLLTNNGSNIKLFKEDGCINKLCAWFSPDSSHSTSWPEQRKVNACGMLQIVRSLVSPTLSQQIVKTCQDAIFKCKLFTHICGILMMPGVPLVVLIQALNTVAEMIRGNRQNQDDFAAMEAPTKPPRPVLAILCVSMFNERQTLDLRLAVLYVLKSFLLKNEPMQMIILQSFTPTADSPQYTLGQLLGGGLFSTDLLNQWCSTIALLHCILGDDKHKLCLLNAQFSPSSTLPTSTIFLQCATILRESSNVQAKIGVLQLFCIWLSECPKAVSAFLNIPDMMLALLSQILDVPLESSHRLFQGLCAFLFGIAIYYNEDSNSRNQLLDLVRNRISFDTFRDKISEVPRHECFVKAAQLPDPAIEKGGHVPLLDYDFIRFYKTLEGKIFETLDPSQGDLTNGHEGRKPGIFAQQKEALQQKEDRIAHLESQLSFSNSRYSDALQKIQDLDRRVTLLISEIETRNLENSNLQSQVDHYRNFAEVNQASSQKVTALEQNIHSLTAKTAELEQSNEHYKLAAVEVDQLRQLVNHQQEQISSYYAFYETQQQGGDPAAALLIEKADLLVRMAHLESLLYSWQSEAGRQREENELLKNELAKKDAGIGERINSAIMEEKSRHEHLRIELEHTKMEYEELNKEHTDLLEMLSEADQKLRSYRVRLRLYGEMVSDDEE